MMQCLELIKSEYNTCNKRTLYILTAISLLPLLFPSSYKNFFCLPLILFHSKWFSLMKNSVKYILEQFSSLLDLVIQDIFLKVWAVFNSRTQCRSRICPVNTIKNHFFEVYINFEFIVDITRNWWIAICGSTLFFTNILNNFLRNLQIKTFLLRIFVFWEKAKFLFTLQAQQLA